MSEPSTPVTLERFLRWITIAAVILGVYWLLDQLSSVLLPFLLAWLTAYLVDPAVRFVQRWVKKRVPAVLIVLITGLLLINTLLVLLVPAMIHEAMHLYELLNTQLQTVQLPQWIPRDLVTRATHYLREVDYAAFLQQEGVADQIAAVARYVWGLISGVYGILGALFGLITYTLYLIFILIDFDEISEGWINYVPEKYRAQVRSVADDLEEGMNNYFRAQSKLVAVVCVLFVIGFKLIGLPFAIVLGIGIGLLNYIPYLQIAGTIPAFILAALDSFDTGDSLWLNVALLAVVFAVVQLAQDLYLTPKLMGGISGFNPAIILLSLSIWGALLGMVGLIIAIPLTSLLVNYYRRYLQRGKDDKLAGQEEN